MWTCRLAGIFPRYVKGTFSHRGGLLTEGPTAVVSLACLLYMHHNQCASEKDIFTIISKLLQYNLNGSNPDGSFTGDDSNSFFSPYKILPIAQENKYLGIFSYFIMELCCVYSL